MMFPAGQCESSAGENLRQLPGAARPIRCSCRLRGLQRPIDAALRGWNRRYFFFAPSNLRSKEAGRDDFLHPGSCRSGLKKGARRPRQRNRRPVSRKPLAVNRRRSPFFHGPPYPRFNDVSVARAGHPRWCLIRPRQEKRHKAKATRNP